MGTSAPYASLFTVIHLFVSLLACFLIVRAHAVTQVWRSPDNVWKLSPSTMWVLGIKLRFGRLGGKPPYLVSHLVGLINWHLPWEWQWLKHSVHSVRLAQAVSLGNLLYDDKIDVQNVYLTLPEFRQCTSSRASVGVVTPGALLQLTATSPSSTS